MTPEQRELYEYIILDHNEHPRHYHTLEAATHHAEGYNPVCGDHYHIYLVIENATITQISFRGHGCAISKASASIMTSLLSGKTTAEAEALFKSFLSVLQIPVQDPVPDVPGDLAALTGVRQYPNRVKCVNLAWRAFMGAIEGEATVSTE